MSIVHTGSEIPFDPVRFDPDGKEWITVGWDADIVRHGAIQQGSSEWKLPDVWTSLEEREDVAVTGDDGTAQAHANQVLVSTTQTTGRAEITNRVTFADGTIRERSYGLIVGDI